MGLPFTMPSAESDMLARRAAGLFVAGQAATVAEAIRIIMAAADATDIPAPSHGRVRQHIRGMTMQNLGEAAYSATIRDIWESAETLMTLLEESPLDIRTMIVGRAARGEIDGDVRVRIRLLTRVSVAAITDLLEMNGYGPTRIETINSRYGRLNQVNFEDGDHEFVLTRCPPDMKIARDRDILHGRKIETASLEDLRRRMKDHKGIR